MARKLLWFVGIWAASVLAIGGLATLLHAWLVG
jgi:hypothetical protein